VSVDQYIHTKSTFCPACGHKDCRYVEIPPSRLIYTYTYCDEQVTKEYGWLRNYLCHNCGHTWLMAAAQ
jgi:ribosomal protein S27AE